MAEGLTLKGWKVGRKLGSGACSDVYAGARRSRWLSPPSQR